MPLRIYGVTFVAALAALAGCSEPNEYAPPPPPQVTVAKPTLADVQGYFTTVGQTRAVNTVQLRARVSGYLDSIQFQDGDIVEQGQVLFTIDRAPYEAAVQSAEAALAKAEANLQLAEQQLARTRPLVSRNALSESELDQDIAERASAEADVRAAEAALREERLDLGYTEIRAPFTGRIGRRRIDLGNLVQPGETLLATLESIDPIYAYFTISESDLLRFMQMQRSGELTLGDDEQIQVELAIGTEADYAHQGHIDFREFGVDPGTGTTERRAVFSNDSGVLRPGLFVQIRVPVGPPTPRLLVEERAIGADQRGDFVLVVDDDNTVEYRKVQLGELKGEMRVILQGVDAEDRVIVEGVQRAPPGSEVQPEEQATEPSPPANEPAETSTDSAESQ